ncbi:hypothetical protein V8C86DRAFT_3034042 [Haematococcus lacustris]
MTQELSMAVLYGAGYLAIIAEELLGLEKAAIALLMAAGLWSISATSTPQVVEEIGAALGEVSQVIFFLMGAMTIVEVVDSHQATARLNGEDAEEDVVLRAFLKAPKIADFATRSKAAASTQAKDKSQLKTSYKMFEEVLDSGKYADGEVASEEVMAALRLFLRKRPLTIEERCSHLYECYMKMPKVLCMVLCTLATGYRKSTDGGKCNADSLRQRISSLARVVRGEHHRVKISENDMAPILEPDDLMDFKGRFALMWKVVDGHDKAAFKAGEDLAAGQRAGIRQRHRLRTEAPLPPQDLAAGPWAGRRQRHRLRTEAPLPPQDLAAGPRAGMQQRHWLRTEAPLPPQDLAAGPVVGTRDMWHRGVKPLKAGIGHLPSIQG